MKLYNNARTLYERGEYEGARDLCSLHILSYPLSPIKEDVQYLLAQSFFKEGHFRKAEYEFKMYLRNYPITSRKTEIKKKINLCQNDGVEVSTEDETLPVEELAVEITYGEDSSEAPVLELPEKSGKRETLRCAQILVLNCDNLDEVSDEINKLAYHQVDTIILRVFQNRGDRFYPFIKPSAQTGVYFDTAEAPVVSDILSPIIEICKNNGMKVFAWMTTRYCDWLLEDHPEYVEKEYDLSRRRFITSKGLNIFHPDVVEYLTRLYMDLALYDIDGILFQDDLVLRHTQGFNQFAIEEFEDFLRIKLNPRKMFQGVYKKKTNGKYYVERYDYPFKQWAKFKNRKILELADSIMRAVRAVNPDIKFALNLYYEAVSDPENALYWLSQDIIAAKEYDFDYYSMMSYHDQIAKELKLSRHEAIYFIGKIASRLADLLDDPSMALMKIQTIDWKSGKYLPDWEIDEAFDSVTQTKGISLAFVPYREGVPLDVIEKHYEK